MRMYAVRLSAREDEEITQKLDLAIERLKQANERQQTARERLHSEVPGAPDETPEIKRASDPGSGPRKTVD